MPIALHRRGNGRPIQLTLSAPGVAPSQVGSFAPGTPTVTTIPVSYTAAGGTEPITYAGHTAPHGSGTWAPNPGTFADTGGSFVGLMGGTNYDLRVVTSNAYGSATRDYLLGTTTTTSSWTNGLTATRYDIVLGASSGAASSARTATLYPNGNWPSSGSITLTATNGTVSPSAMVTLSGGSSPVSVTWTPSAAGELAISGTNTAGLSDPWPAPYTCLIAASGTVRTLTVTTGVWTDPTGAYVKDRRTYQKDTPIGNPNGFSTTANAGWGAVWFQINPAGSSSGVFVRLYDADSSGVTTMPGTGTLVQAAVQIYGAVAAGSQTIRALLPASDTRYYADLATDAAFTNPVRVPQSFFVRDVVAILVRSQEGGLATSWQYGGAPGTGYANYTKTTGIVSWSSGSDTTVTDAWFASSWADYDGADLTFKNTTDGNFYYNSAAGMELGRLWKAYKGHGVGIVVVVVVDGSNAAFLNMIGSDGTPCQGFRDALTYQCGGKFRYLKTGANDGGDFSSSLSVIRTALKGFVSYVPAHYPACAVMSLSHWSGLGAGAGANGAARADAIVQNEIEPANPMVVSGNANYDWTGFNGGHADWASQVRYTRAAVRSMLAAETPTFGGFGYALGQRGPRLASNGTIVSGSGVIKLPFTLPTGATQLLGKKWPSSSNSTFTYSSLAPGDYQGWIYIYAGSAPPSGTNIRFSGITIDNTNRTLNIALDTSGGAGVATYSDGSTGAMPTTFNVVLGAWWNLNPYVNSGSTVYAVGLFDDRTNTAQDGIEYGWLLPPKLDITVTTV